MSALLDDVYADCEAGGRFEEGLAVARASLESWQRLYRLGRAFYTIYVDEQLILSVQSCDPVVEHLIAKLFSFKL